MSRDIFRLLQELLKQLEAMQEELEVRRTEVIHLKSIIARQPSFDDKVRHYLKEHVISCRNLIGWKYFYFQATTTGPELLGSRNRMEDITLDKLDKSDLKAVLVKVYDHNRLVQVLMFQVVLIQKFSNA